MKTVKGVLLLTIFIQNSISDASMGSEWTPAIEKQYLMIIH